MKRRLIYGGVVAVLTVNLLLGLNIYLNAAQTGAKGTGLGLAMVRHIVTAHGGSVRMESTPGAGSTFTIELPTGRDQGSGIGVSRRRFRSSDDVSPRSGRPGEPFDLSR